MEPYQAVADGEKVKDKLLTPLAIRAGKNAIYDRTPLQAVIGGLVVADRLALGLTPDRAGRVKIVSDEWIHLPNRTLLVGKQDPILKKCWVQLEGEDRADLVEDTIVTLMNRKGMDFRSSKLFDLGDNRISEVIVQAGSSETFILHEVPGANVTNWELLSPVKTKADTSKADQFVNDLGQLQVTEYVEELKSTEAGPATPVGLGGIAAAVVPSLASFGLDKPAFTITLKFTSSTGDKRLADKVIEVGAARVGKSEYFARFKGDNTIFAIGISIPDQVKTGSVAFLPLQLWEGSDSDIKRIEIKRGKDELFAVTRTEKGWDLTEPFKTTISAGQLAPLAGSLANVKAERYEANAAQDLKKYGLDAPILRVKFEMTEKTPATETAPAKEVLRERTLLVGSPAAVGKPGHFAKLEGSPAIFVIGDVLFLDANKSVYDLFDRRLLSIAANSIIQLQSTTPDGNVTLVKDGLNWKPEGASFSIDKPAIDSILKTLGTLTAVEFVAYGTSVKWNEFGLDAGSNPATLLVKQEKDSHKIEIGKLVDAMQPHGGRYARVDGGLGVALLSGPTASILRKGKLDLVDRSLLRFDSVEVQAIRRTKDKSELDLIQNATGTWDITKPAMQKADQTTMDELVDLLANLRADSIKAIDAKNLPDFGLEPAVATLKIELLDKRGKTKEKVLRIGKPVDPVKPEGDRFAMVDGSTVIAALNGDFAKRFLAEPTKFRDRSMANLVNADKIVLQNGDRKATFVKAAGAWKLKEPLEAPAEDEALRELHDRLARLRPDELVVEKPTDLKKFGLDRPVRWQLFSGDKEVLNLLVGKKEGDRAYAKLDKGDVVVLLEPDLTKRLTAEYRKRTLWETLDVASNANFHERRSRGEADHSLSLKPRSGGSILRNPRTGSATRRSAPFLGAMSNSRGRSVCGGRGRAGIEALRAGQAANFVSYQAIRANTEASIGQPERIQTCLCGALDEPNRTDCILLSEEDARKINRDRASFGLLAPKKIDFTGEVAEHAQRTGARDHDNTSGLCARRICPRRSSS